MFTHILKKCFFPLFLALTVIFSAAVTPVAAEDLDAVDFFSRAGRVMDALLGGDAMKLAFTNGRESDNWALQIQADDELCILTEGSLPPFVLSTDGNHLLIRYDNQVYDADIQEWLEFFDSFWNGGVVGGIRHSADAVLRILEKLFDSAVTVSGSTTVIRLSGREVVMALDEGIGAMLGDYADAGWLDMILASLGTGLRASDLAALWKQLNISKSLGQDLMNAYCLITATSERTMNGVATIIDAALSMSRRVITCSLIDNCNRQANGYVHEGEGSMIIDEVPLKLAYTIKGNELDATLTSVSENREEPYSLHLYGHIGESVSLHLMDSRGWVSASLTLVNEYDVVTGTLVYSSRSGNGMVSCVFKEDSQAVNIAVNNRDGRDRRRIDARLDETDGRITGFSFNNSGVYGWDSTRLLWKGNKVICQVYGRSYTAAWNDDRSGSLTVDVDDSWQQVDDETENDSPDSGKTGHYASFKLTADEESRTLTVNARLPGMPAAEIRLMPSQFVETEPINTQDAVSITPAMIPSLLDSLW